MRGTGAKREEVAWRSAAVSKNAPIAPTRAVSAESCSEKMTIDGTQIQPAALARANRENGSGGAARNGLDGLFQ
jgi:hypothetical protein